MTEIAHHEDTHAVGHGAPPPRHGLAHLTGAGYIRAAWVTPLFWAIGFGIVVFFRWLGGYEPTVDWSIITVVASLQTIG